MTLYWMLNSHWPSFYGNIIDYYLTPVEHLWSEEGSAPLSVVFDSYAAGDHSQAKIIVFNQTSGNVQGLRARIRVYDLNGKLRDDRSLDGIAVPFNREKQVAALAVPVNRTMPAPVSASAPLPLSVPASVSVVPPLGMNVPPPAPAVTARADVNVPVLASAPPPSVTAFAASPRLVSAPTLRVPAATVTAPVKVFAPDDASVPGAFSVDSTLPLSTPDSVSVVEAFGLPARPRRA